MRVPQNREGTYLLWSFITPLRSLVRASESSSTRVLSSIHVTVSWQSILQYIIIWLIIKTTWWEKMMHGTNLKVSRRWARSSSALFWSTMSRSCAQRAFNLFWRCRISSEFGCSTCSSWRASSLTVPTYTGRILIPSMCKYLRRKQKDRRMGRVNTP